MTCAVSAAVREGAEAVICASTGNTAASAAAYAARAGLRGAVIVPEGKIATGKLAQALMHGARVVALRGNFDQALDAGARARRPPPDRARQLGQRRSGSRGRRPPRSRSLDELGRDRRAVHPGRQRRATSPPTGRASRSAARAPRMLGFQAEGAAPLVRGEPVAQPGDGGQRDPHRQPGPLGGGDGRRDRLARRDRARSRTTRSSPPSGLLAAREGVFCEPASAAVGGRPAAPRRRGRRSGSCACSPATASRTRRRRSTTRAPSCRASPSSRRSSGGARGEPPPRLVRVPASSANLGPGYDVLAAAAVGLHLELEVEETGRFAVETDLDVARDRRNLVRARVRAPASARGLHVPHPLVDPAVGRAGLERGGDRRRARWPPTTCSSSTPTCSRTRPSSRATPTTPPPRCSAASSSAPTARRRASMPRPGWRRSLVVPHEAVRTARGARGDARAGADRGRRVHRRARLAARPRPGGRRLGPRLPRAGRPAAPAPPRPPLPALDGARRARAASSGRWARRSPAPGPTVLVWTPLREHRRRGERAAARGRRAGPTSCACRSSPRAPTCARCRRSAGQGYRLRRCHSLDRKEAK